MNVEKDEVAEEDKAGPKVGRREEEADTVHETRVLLARHGTASTTGSGAVLQQLLLLLLGSVDRVGGCSHAIQI